MHSPCGDETYVIIEIFIHMLLEHPKLLEWSLMVEITDNAK